MIFAEAVRLECLHELCFLKECVNIANYVLINYLAQILPFSFWHSGFELGAIACAELRAVLEHVYILDFLDEHVAPAFELQVICLDRHIVTHRVRLEVRAERIVRCDLLDGRELVHLLGY